MGTPVVTVASGGIAVTEVANGLPIDESTTGGMAVTIVASGGLGVTFGTGGAGGGGAVPIATTSQTSAAHEGATFNFSKAMPVGTYEDGSPFVVADSDFQITSVSPASAVTNGGWANGLALNPYFATTQPYDEFIASGNASADVPYDGASNVDPGATGSGISVPSGSSRSYVKARRVAGMVSADGRWQTIEAYGVLTVVPTAPAVGSYRPGVASLAKTSLNKNNLNTAALRSLSLPASFIDTPSTIAAKVPDYVALLGLTGGERARRLRTDVALGTTTSNYSRDIAPAYAEMLVNLHRSGISDADRDAILKKVALHASDVAGLVERGYTGGAARGEGAGQRGAIQPMVFAAAMLFNSSSMLATARSLNTSMLANGIWIDSDDVGIRAPGNSTRTGQTYLPEMVGDPFIVPDDETSEQLGRYVPVAATIQAWEVPAIALFQNGPGGINGLQAMVDGAYDNTNQKAATPCFLSNRRQWAPAAMFNADGPTTKDTALHDLVVANLPAYEWSGKPQQIPFGNVAPYLDNWFTAGDGSISWDISAVDYATEAVTRIDIRYSLDRRTWTEVSSVATTGSVTGLLKGAQYFVGVRRHSASGVSAWSNHYPLEKPFTGTPRGAPTTTGTASNAAPVNTVAPKITRRLYPLWTDYDMWEESPSTLGATDRNLSAGVGFYTGHPAPTFTYQWKRGGVSITGATSKEYTKQFVDGGATLTCDVTATNGSGSVTTTTAGVAVPANATTDYVRLNSGGTAYATKATGGWGGLASGKQATIAFKGRLLGNDGLGRRIVSQNTSTEPLLAQFRSTTNIFSLQVRNAGGTIIGQVYSANGIGTVAAGELTCVISFDLATGAAHCYVNGVSSRSGTDILTNDTINWGATTALSLFGRNDGTSLLNAEGDYIFLDDKYVDLSVAANRDKFLTSAAMLGDGSGPIGSTPLVYFTGPVADANAGYGNRGRGGLFTVAAGAFT